MARGNQRDKAREANLKKQAAQKMGNSQTGYQRQKSNDINADIMRQKQAAFNARKASGKEPKKK